MMTRPLRILLIGDASNCHQCLATGLRRLGHKVTVASAGSGWMKTNRDIDISRPVKGKLGGLALWAKLHTTLGGKLKGFDVVSLSSPGFVELRPERTAAVFDKLVRDNGHVFMTLLETDSYYVEECLKPDGVLRYNEWMVNGRLSPLALARPEWLRQWQSAELRELARHIYDNIAGATAVLFEYWLTGRQHIPESRLGYIGIPIDTEAIKPVATSRYIDKVRILLGRHRDRKIEKGTDILEQAAREVISRHPDKSELTIIENIPYAQYLKRIGESHIMLDQLYSYTPATNALLGMAKGLSVVTGGEPDFYDFIGEHENHPIVNASIDYSELVENIERTVLEKDLLAVRGERSRQFVVKHNDCVTVARRAIDFWTRHL